MIHMGSVGNPQSWVPYQNIKDCSQGFCSLYCPQWCYIIFPPPPPYEFPDEDSGTNFSPLVIAIIGILASAFLLVSYYTVISKYCGNLDSRRRRRASNDSNDEFNENQNNPSNHEPWQTSATGLDEALIKTITVCKYNKKDGLIDGTDCSVCLSEFQEDESLRLLPKCSHAFHLTCIDTWLKSHSNCPLCRANIVSVACPLQIQLPPLPPPVRDHQAIDNIDSTECEHENHTGIALEEFERRRNTTSTEEVSSSSHTRSDLVEERDTIIEIRDEGIQQIRRSVSMDSTCRDRVSIADVLGMNLDEDSDQMEEEDHGQVQSGIGSSNKRHLGGESKSDINRRRALHCGTNPIAMKRSISSGRFLFSSTRHGRGMNVILPM